MASQTNNIGTTAILLFIISMFMGAIFLFTSDVSNKNTKLDLDSESLMASLGQEYSAKYNDSAYFQTIESNVTSNSTFEGVDAFSRQYLEDKSQITQIKGTVEKIYTFPSLLLIIFGVKNAVLLIIFNNLVISLITLFVGLQIYKAIKTGEVD